MGRIDQFLTKLQGVKKTPGGYIARCPVPAHNDKSPSLSLRETANGDILLHCFGMCEFGDILAALDMRASDCFAKSRQSTPVYRAQHKVNALEAEAELLSKRYGMEVSTAKELVRVRVLRELGGLN